MPKLNQTPISSENISETIANLTREIEALKERVKALELECGINQDGPAYIKADAVNWVSELPW